MTPRQKASEGNVSEMLPAAADVLARWETETLSLDDLLDDIRDNFPPRIRAGITSLLLTYFRHRGAVLNMVESLQMKFKPKLRRLVELGATQLHYQQGLPPHAVVNSAVDYAKRRYGGVPGNVVNAALRRIADLEVGSFADQLPKFLDERWASLFGKEKTLELAAEIGGQPSFTFRKLIPTPLPFDAVAIKASELPENLFYIVPKPRDLFASGILNDGTIYIQDPSTFLFVKLLRDQQIGTIKSVLDACCAPGGKSLLAAQFLSPEKVVCADRSAERQMRTRENIERCGKHFPIVAFEVVVADASTRISEEKFDLVLLDVPCSNTGVLKRRPDAAWRLTAQKISELNIIQMRLLTAQCEAVKKGGYLIYSTCSLEREENAGMIQSFCAQHPEFEMVADEQLFPCAYRDGGYAALLKRRDQSIA